MHVVWPITKSETLLLLPTSVKKTTKKRKKRTNVLLVVCAPEPRYMHISLSILVALLLLLCLCDLVGWVVVIVCMIRHTQQLLCHIFSLIHTLTLFAHTNFLYTYYFWNRIRIEFIFKGEFPSISCVLFILSSNGKCSLIIWPHSNRML